MKLRRIALPRLIAKLFLELLQGLIQFVLCHQIAAVVCKLKAESALIRWKSKLQHGTPTCITVFRIRHNL